MRRQARVWCVLVMMAFVATYAAALQNQAAQPESGSQQLQTGGQDVITASDGGGGYLSLRDIILIVIIVFAVIGFIAVV